MALRSFNNFYGSDLTAAFLEEFGDRNKEQPEIKMWKMVLHRAVWDYKTFWEFPNREKWLLAKQAQQWIRRPGNILKPSPSSCIWVCYICFPEFFPRCVDQLRQEVSQDLPPSKMFQPSHQLRKSLPT